MSSIKKKQEEKNLKILRELLTFENNRYCFDCSQRGPTYVNITIGSFVCTNCGGALRKYNHRVKSISMSNFSQSEMDFIKKRGNNICKKIYYGLCENNTPPEPDIKNGMLDSHLRSKYELKKWYLEPSTELEEESISVNQIIFDRVEKGVPKTTKSYTVNSSTNIIIDPPKPLNAKLGSSRGSRTSIDLVESIASHAKPANGPFQDVMIDPAKLGGGSSVKLPISSADTRNHPGWLAGPAAGDKTIKKSLDSSPFDDDFILQTALSTGQQTGSGVVPRSQTMNFSMPPLVPLVPSGHNSAATGLSDGQSRETKHTDKYAVLAELDDLFSNINVNKQNQSAFSTPLDSSFQLSSSSSASMAIHSNNINNMGWSSAAAVAPHTHQFSDIHSKSSSLSNPFSQPSQPVMPTFNPFVIPSHNDISHMSSPHNIPGIWPGSGPSSMTQAPGNPFINPINNDATKSKNPFL